MSHRERERERERRREKGRDREGKEERNNTKYIRPYVCINNKNKRRSGRRAGEGEK